MPRHGGRERAPHAPRDGPPGRAARSRHPPERVEHAGQVTDQRPPRRGPEDGRRRRCHAGNRAPEDAPTERPGDGAGSQPAPDPHRTGERPGERVSARLTGCHGARASTRAGDLAHPGRRSPGGAAIEPATAGGPLPGRPGTPLPLRSVVLPPHSATPSIDPGGHHPPHRHPTPPRGGPQHARCLHTPVRLEYFLTPIA